MESINFISTCFNCKKKNKKKNPEELTKEIGDLNTGWLVDVITEL